MVDALVMDEIRHCYRGADEVVALDGVSVSVRPGELVAVVGPSGSGKSTLLTIAGALETPTAGSVTIEGVRLDDLDTDELAELRRRRLGFVFQGYNLLAGLTAAENVAAPLELDGVSATAARGAALDALARVGLTDRAQAYPDELSGGQQQRVAIARALVGDRRLILADEPTGALDRANGQAVMELLRTACDSGVACAVATHDPAVVEWADRVVELIDGRVQHPAVAP